MKSGNDLIIDVQAVTRASKSEIVVLGGGAVKVRLISPPVEGAANQELIKLLSKFFDVPRSCVEIVSGASSRRKRVRLIGASQEMVRLVTREEPASSDAKSVF